jgi:hypothetical protein
MTYPWYERLLLVDPDRVMTHLARMRAAGVVDESPNAWQLSLGVLRMWHRVVWRSETVGTSSAPVRASWRARLLHHRAARLPCLLAANAVIPFDFTGLRSPPATLIDHLIGAHHDGNQFVFDLELLAGHGVLDELTRRVTAIVDGSDPRAEWLRDLAVFVGYHESLAAAAAAARASGPRMTATEAFDPDITLRGLVAWCARQPATPAATVAAWSDGRFWLDARPTPTPPTRDALLAASRGELAARFAAGHPVTPAALAGAEYHGTSLGLPRWVERLTWKTFIKAFVADDRGEVRGWNVRVDQGTPWSPRLRRGTPITFGHFAARFDGATTMLDYGAGGNRWGDPTAALRDPLVALEPSAERLLGVSLIQVAGQRVPTPAFFLLERGGPVRHVARPR